MSKHYFLLALLIVGIPLEILADTAPSWHDCLGTWEGSGVTVTLNALNVPAECNSEGSGQCTIICQDSEGNAGRSALIENINCMECENFRAKMNERTITIRKSDGKRIPSRTEVIDGTQ